MSRKQDLKKSGRTCSSCGRPSGHRRVCAHCSPRRTTRTHRDKYPKEVTS
jgi:hypothetical protein